MAYIEEPMSKLEQIIGRRTPITYSLVIALIAAIYFNNETMTTGIMVLLTAVVTTLFRDIGQEKANNSIIRQEAASEVKNG